MASHCDRQVISNVVSLLKFGRTETPGLLHTPVNEQKQMPPPHKALQTQDKNVHKCERVFAFLYTVTFFANSNTVSQPYYYFITV